MARPALRGAWRRAAALSVALPLSGCSMMFGGYDLAPNGLTRDEDAFRRDLAFQAPKTYQSTIEGQRPLPDDDLLRLLYAGIAGRYAGALEESSRLLDVASYLAEDRVTLSLSREALSLITSDRALAYVPAPTERLMIPYLAALNYLDAGDLDGAAVEARRIEALLDQNPDDPNGSDGRQPFLHYFAGAVFEAARDWNAADVAYRRAQRALELSGGGWEHGAGPLASDSAGDVVVLVEQGFVPHRVEQSVVIVLPARQVKMLTEGSAGDKVVAAAESAARILLTASYHYGDRSGFHRDQRFRSPLHLEPWHDAAFDDEEEENGTPYLLRISWPVLYQEPAAAGTVRVRAGELAAAPVARLDVAGGVRSDFDAQRTTTLARTVARAASKLAISTAVEHSVTQHDEAAGKIAGLLTNLGTLATERADTRGWHLLPGEVAMVRLRLPVGEHELMLDTGTGAGVDLGAVQVRPGQTTFVTTRLWR